MVHYELDNIDRQIIAFLIENARIPFTEIAKKLDVSPGTIHVRVKKMEQYGIIQGASLKVDYEAIGYNFTAYVGVFITHTRNSQGVIEQLKKIPEVTVAHITTGRFGIFCKIRCKDTAHAKDVIFKINQVENVLRTESMISLEENINDKERLFRSIFKVKGRKD